MSLVTDILSGINITESLLDKVAMKKGGLVGVLTSQDDPELFKAKLVCDYGYTTIHKPGPCGSGISRVFLVGTTDQKKQLIERGKRSLIQKACPTWGGSVIERYLDFRKVNSGVFFYAEFVYKYMNVNAFRTIIDSMPEGNLNKASVYDNSWRKQNHAYLKACGMDSWSPAIEVGFVKFLKELKKQKFISF